MRIILTTDPELSKFVQRLDDIAKKQVPYAVSKAINESLLFAQGQIRRELPEHFKIRSNWVAKGIKVTFANKRTLTGTIFTKDEFMARQELGGDKPRQGKEQAIPFAVRGEYGGDQKTLQSRWPGQLVGKDKAFEIRTENRIGLVLRSKGRGKRKNELLYMLLGKTVKVKPRWNFRARVTQVVNQIFPMVFKSELAKAISTARR